MNNVWNWVRGLVGADVEDHSALIDELDTAIWDQVRGRARQLDSNQMYGYLWARVRATRLLPKTAPITTIIEALTVRFQNRIAVETHSTLRAAA